MNGDQVVVSFFQLMLLSLTLIPFETIYVKPNVIFCYCLRNVSVLLGGWMRRLKTIYHHILIAFKCIGRIYRWFSIHFCASLGGVKYICECKMVPSITCDRNTGWLVNKISIWFFFTLFHHPASNCVVNCFMYVGIHKYVAYTSLMCIFIIISQS